MFVKFSLWGDMWDWEKEDKIANYGEEGQSDLLMCEVTLRVIIAEVLDLMIWSEGGVWHTR